MVDTSKDPLRSVAEQQQYSPLVVPQGPFQLDKVLGILSARSEVGSADVVTYAGRVQLTDPVSVEGGMVIFRHESVNLYLAPMPERYEVKELDDFLDGLFLENGQNKVGGISALFHGSYDRTLRRGRVLTIPGAHFEETIGAVRLMSKVEYAVGQPDLELLRKFRLQEANSAEHIHPDVVRDFAVTRVIDVSLFPHMAFAERVGRQDWANENDELRAGEVRAREIRAVQKGKDPNEHEQAVYGRAIRRFPPDYSAWRDS